MTFLLVAWLVGQTVIAPGFCLTRPSILDIGKRAETDIADASNRRLQLEQLRICRAGDVSVRLAQHLNTFTASDGTPVETWEARLDGKRVFVHLEAELVS